MKKDANYWIDTLKLIMHPEGGYYCETYKSTTLEKHEQECTSLIYFLLNSQDFSAFHKLKSDEIWLYHYGSAVNIYMLKTNGDIEMRVLGKALENNEFLQVLVPANTWFAADLANKNSFGLMSCVVTPAFKWDDFELAKKDQLILNFPNNKAIIERLCI